MNLKPDQTYRQVVQALQEINARRTFDTLNAPERPDLDKAVLALEELSWQIVAKDASKFTQSIRTHITELKALAQKIEQTYQDLKAIGKTLRTTAEVVAGFVKTLKGVV
jgi:antitoxin component HigA of HigAB toxin-antitoxin module